ncbi:MAG: TetR/AcrR family transcriptional regulator [Enterococcus lemanii]
MARKKTITREQILIAAYQVIADNGFSHFTARNIALQMNCSTQPIYLEFKNMDDLKDGLFTMMAEKVNEDFLAVRKKQNILVELGTNFIELAVNQPQLYRALYLEEISGASQMQVAFREYFYEVLKQDDVLRTLDLDKQASLYCSFWIFISGIASMISTELLHYSKTEIEALLSSFIEATLEDKGKEITLFTLGNFFKNN